MADDEGALDSQQPERFWEDRRLRRGGPVAAARPLAVTEPGPVESNRPVPSCGLVDHATNQQIVNHGAVAMKKDNRWAAPLLDIVKPRAAGRYEAPASWIYPLRLPCLPFRKRRRPG
jgi:hypothetical protein